MKPTIFLDLDEVLADFVAAAARQIGVPLAQLNANRAYGEWSIVPAIARTLHRDDYTEDQFWIDIEKGGADFWTSIPLLPHAREVIDVVQRYDPDFFIVTSPSRAIDCYVGKIRWIREHLGINRRFIFSNDKSMLARYGTILIDDREESCIKFRDAGGCAILVRNMFNYPRLFKGSTVDAIQSNLNSVASVIDRDIGTTGIFLK